MYNEESERESVCDSFFHRESRAVHKDMYIAASGRIVGDALMKVSV